MQYYARTSDHGYESCVEHLVMAGSCAGVFANQFGYLDEGLVGGLLHDIGKYSDDFQEMIRHTDTRRHVDHSTAGAQVALKELRNSLLPFSIAGHHAGIPDLGASTTTSESSALQGRLKRVVPDYSAWKEQLNVDGINLSNGYTNSKESYSEMMLIRMLFSCLIDGDRLDAESFTNLDVDRQETQMIEGFHDAYGTENLADERAPKYERMHKQCEIESDKVHESQQKTLRRLLAVCRDKNESFFTADNKSTLDNKRCDLLRQCTQHGSSPDWGSDIYTLTAPTGSGKTNASLTFALEHAVAHNKSRIIYVIPYTSIIDQTVGKFEEEFGTGVVLPHYGEASYQLIGEDDLSGDDLRKSLASENWNAPIVVTTAVQFFESLYSNKTSQCRKLHNIANSVVIFDEAQTLPVPYLKPCVQAIAELTKHYGVTSLLCTATQPALNDLFADAFDDKSRKIREIAPMSEDDFSGFRRNRIEYIGDVELLDLAVQLDSHKQVLCVVNTRAEAQQIYNQMVGEGSDEGYFCLTTLLCASDRVQQFAQIKERLGNDMPCKVVSTSLIEAGVDLDFPAAYREKTGLDSILQTAGRCNREGNGEPDECVVKVFSTREGNLSMISQNRSALDAVMKKYEDIQSLAAIHAYFKGLLSLKGDKALDSNEILRMHEMDFVPTMPFVQICRKFKLIDSPTVPVYVQINDESKSLCEQLVSGHYSRQLFRKLGKYAVNVWPRQLENLQGAGAILGYSRDGDAGEEECYVLRDVESFYNQKTGLNVEEQYGRGISV